MIIDINYQNTSTALVSAVVIDNRNCSQVVSLALTTN